MKRINVLNVFANLNKYEYCVIKKPDNIQEYSYGSDFDIFCIGIERVVESIMASLGDMLNENQTIEVSRLQEQIYIDVIEDNKINIRFDLYSSLPLYKRLCIKESFFGYVVARYEFDDSGLIKIASKEDELILRYVEYHEWYSERPDKIKHVDYILKMYSEIEIEMAIKKFHYFIDFPSPIIEKRTRFDKMTGALCFYTSRIEKLFSYLKKNGIKKTADRIREKI
ncbi:conserved hypothetical protein [Vibrio chagasii]|nr:conserved hypothetical protein [Vibrio chagasii]CAH6896465.1 conserved hypothetical protein [Vibrio chagasii]